MKYMAIQVKTSHRIAQSTGSADKYFTTDWNHRRLDDNWQDYSADEKQRERCDTLQLPYSNMSTNDVLTNDNYHSRSNSRLQGGKRICTMGAETQPQKFKRHERPTPRWQNDSAQFQAVQDQIAFSLHRLQKSLWFTSSQLNNKMSWNIRYQ